MRKPFSLLLALFALIAAYFYLRHPSVEAEVAAIPRPNLPVPTSPPNQLPSSTAPIKKKGSFRPKGDGGPPQGNVVPFQVEDGMAIAYGDIILGEPDDPQLTEGYYEAPTPSLWDRPEVPYAIQNDVPEPQRVKEAIEYFNKHTPVQFIPYDGSQADAVVFENGNDNCYSLLGKQGGLQPIKLARDCDWLAIAHEMMHVLGFVHEQSRSDRDRYLEILWPNIQDKYQDQFRMVPEAFMEASRQGAFDYRSIMLYTPDAFAKEKGMVTMRTRTNEAIKPTNEGLSPGDIEKIRELYRPYVRDKR